MMEPGWQFRCDVLRGDRFLPGHRVLSPFSGPLSETI